LSASEERGEAGATKAAAFFDVDGTILTVQSGVLYIGYLRRQGLMDLPAQLRIYWAYLTYRLGVLNMRRLADVTSAWLRGRSEREVADHCLHWYETEVRRYVRPGIERIVREHQRAGHAVALLTGGTRYLNDHIAADLGIPHVLASRLEVVDGSFTGNPIPPLCYGRGKLAYAEAFAAEHGVRLEDSYFYTDSITDLPMLERVGYPRVISPDPRLRVRARQRGWTVLDLERQSEAGMGRRGHSASAPAGRR